MLSVETFTQTILNELNPEQSFRSLINLYHDSFQIKGKTHKVSKKIHIIGLGKAASCEVCALKKIIEDSPLASRLGVCLSYTKWGHTVNDNKIVQWEGDHPYLSEHNVQTTKIFCQSLKVIEPDDTCFFLLSGGASALLEWPREGVELSRLKDIFEDLLKSGENINSINQVRRALGQVKNGGLRSFIAAKTIIQLINCDIPNGDIGSVGSGPLISGPIDWELVNSRIQKHKIKIDPRENLVRGVENIVWQSAPLILQKLESIWPKVILGPIYDARISEVIDDCVSKIPQVGEIFLSGGEGTVEVPPNAGKGGRNTHFVLAMAKKIYGVAHNRDVSIISFATDGSDGPTDAAGAFINYEFFSKLDPQIYLDEFRSYDYFDQIGTIIRTGPTLANVMDIRCIWREKNPGPS